MPMSHDRYATKGWSINKVFGIYHMDRPAEWTFITFRQLTAVNHEWNTFNLNLTTPLVRLTASDV